MCTILNVNYIMEKRDDEIFKEKLIEEGDNILEVKYDGIWLDYAFGYCPYDDKVNIKHYSVKFLDPNYEPPKRYWSLFYDKRGLEESDKRRGKSDDISKDIILELDCNAKIRCWNAIEEYIRRFTFDTHIELRDKEGLNAFTDWGIKVDYDNARRHIHKMKDNLHEINFNNLVRLLN